MYFGGLTPSLRVMKYLAALCGISLYAVDGTRLPGNMRGYHDVFEGRRSIYYRKGDAVSGIENTILHEFREMVEPTFEAVVKSTTVWEEFKKTFPDAHVRQEMLTQLIRHSTGRVIAEDSVGQSVVWIKTANVPNASLVEPVRALLESLDTKGGHWEVAAHDDIDTISLGQLRGGISLSPLIRRLGIPDNEIGWKALAAQAIDVISALIVPPHPSLRQFRRVLAKALAADLITTKDGHFYLERPQQEPLSLGSDFASVKQALLKRWPDLVFIESTYGRALILDEKRVLGQLETLQHRQDMCAALFDAQAFEECLCQTQIMLPRLRRMRVAALREEHL